MHTRVKSIKTCEFFDFGPFLGPTVVAEAIRRKNQLEFEQFISLILTMSDLVDITTRCG